MKSKGVAYLLLLFLGAFGAHKFYLNKIGMGIVYLCTFGILGIGVLIDLFTLGSQVDNYNALFMARSAMTMNSTQNQQVVVNVTAPAPSAAPVATPAPEASSSKESSDKESM